MGDGLRDTHEQGGRITINEGSECTKGLVL